MSQLTDELMKQLWIINEASNSFMRQRKQRLSGQERVLAMLAVEDGVVQSYLVEVLDLRPSSLAELLKKLELSGDITRQEDANDKRVKHIYLTEQGRQRATVLQEKQAPNASDAFFAGLSTAEQADFSASLTKIANGWSPEIKKQAQRFVDPFDRLAAMQQLRNQFMADFDGDWENLSTEEKRELQKKMRNAMKDAQRQAAADPEKFGFFDPRSFGFGGQRGKQPRNPWSMHPGHGGPRPPFPPHFGADFSTDETDRHDFFRGQPFTPHPTHEDDERDTKDTDDWTDF